MKQSTRRILKVLAVLFVIAVLCYAVLIAYVVYREKTVPAPEEYDVIIVLGAQVLPTGEPSVQLDWRLNTALDMYNASPCSVIVCGAQGANEPRTEAEAMSDLLIADGIPADMIYLDSTSTDTYQNIHNAKAIMKRLGLTKPLIITSDYHLPRAMAIAEFDGLDPQGKASPTRQEIGYWLKNHGREALSWVKFWLIRYVGLDL